MYCTKNDNKNEVKRAAAGRWPEILATVAGLPTDALDGKNHPCPKCGGTDRFRLIDAEAGAVFCNQCFNKGNGDGLAAIGWATGCTFPEALEKVASHLGIATDGPQPATRPPSQIDVKYSYHNADGELIFQVLRMKPKGFRQRRPDGNGGWTWKVKGCEVLPYRLPELLASDADKTVYICEGEKDCDNLAALGLVATCNSGGAGKWKSEHAAHLAGRAVVVLPDNDAAGRKHGDQVAHSLDRIAESVKVIELPNLPEKGDVSDWLEQYGDAIEPDAIVADLEKLVEEAAEWQPNGMDDLRPSDLRGEEENEFWPELEPFDSQKLPPFPTDALPDVLQQWVEAVATATQTPHGLAALLALSVCSSLIARKVEVQPREGWTEPTNLFTVTLLPPGNRKSAVFSAAKKPLLGIEVEQMKEAAPDIAKALSERKCDEARIKKMRNSKTSDSLEKRKEIVDAEVALSLLPEPVLPRLLVENVTSEKLEMILGEQGGRVASMSPEGEVFGLMAGKYSSNGSAQFDVYLKGHAGDDLTIDRVTRESVRVERAALTCAYTVQPTVIKSLGKDPAFRKKGLLGRFLYWYPESPVGYRDIDAEAVADGIKANYHRAIRSLFDECENLSADQPTTLTFSAEARPVFRRWEIEVEIELREEGSLGDMTDWGGKLVGATARLAAVMHCIDHGPQGEIGAPAIEAAIVIARALIPHADAVFRMMAAGSGGTDSDARYLLRWIVRSERETFTLRDAHQNGKRRFPKSETIVPALAELTKRGYIRALPQEPKGQGRPPSPAYEVNENVFEIPGKRPHKPQKPLIQPEEVSFEVCENTSGESESKKTPDTAPSEGWTAV